MSETKLKAQSSSTFPQIAGDYTSLGSSFTAAANADEQTVTGLTTTVTGLGESVTVQASCHLTCAQILGGNTNIRLYIDGTKVGNYYSGAAISNTLSIDLVGQSTVSDGNDFDVTVTVQNSGSNQTVFYGTGTEHGRSAVSVITFTNGQ